MASERIRAGEAAWSARLDLNYAECVIASRRRAQEQYCAIDKRMTLLDRFFDAITPSHLYCDTTAHWRKHKERSCYKDYAWRLHMSQGMTKTTPKPPIG